MEEDYILRMNHITKEFSGVRALDDVCFSVRPGEVHGLVGENGAGKSTLMKILSGVYGKNDYRGEIFVNGRPCAFKNVRESEAEGIAIIYQELAMVDCLSLCENLFLGHEIMSGRSIDWDKQYLLTWKAFERVGLNASPDALVETLSIGKQQLAEIAKALVRNVRLLILDEPTAALTEEETAKLFAILAELKSEGITIIFISHKLNEVLSICDTVTVLRDGRVIETMPNTGRAEQAGQTEQADQTDQISERKLIRLMVDRELTQRFPEKTNAPSEGAAFEIKHWTVHNPQYVDRKVVDDASLFVRKGEIVGISGLMGSGRTELATSVFGKIYGANISGELVLDGCPVKLETPRQALNAGVCYMSEDRKGKGLVTLFDIKTNISMSNLGKIIGKNRMIDEHEETRIAENFRGSLRIKAANVEQELLNLSGGNQQKVALGKALNADPKVLIIDEPTRGIDVGAKYEIYAILNEIAARGASVIMISSEMPELIGVCDRIYVMHEGRIKGVLGREDATQEAIMTMALSA